MFAFMEALLPGETVSYGYNVRDGMQIFVNIDDMIYYYREFETGEDRLVDEEDGVFILWCGKKMRLQHSTVNF